MMVLLALHEKSYKNDLPTNGLRRNDDAMKTKCRYQKKIAFTILKLQKKCKHTCI